MKNCTVITRDRSGQILDTRTVPVQNRKSLEKEIKIGQSLVPDYEPEITETAAGELTIIWTKKA